MAKSLKFLPSNDEPIVKPKMTLDDLQKSLNKDTKWKQHSSAEIASKSKLPEVIPTGFLKLDYDLEVGGFPRGRIHMLYGPESGYKSTICLRTVAEAQKLNGQALWLDGERSFDKSWAAKNGVDVENCLVAKPDTLEDALNLIDKAAMGGIDIIVLDSLASLVPTLEKYTDDTRTVLKPIDKEARMALAASVWSKWCRTGPTYIADNGITLLVVNQMRSSLTQYGNPNSVPGGKAVKHMCSIMINIRRLTAQADQILDPKTKQPIGAKYQYTLDKTRFGISGITGQLTVIGTQIDNITALRDIAMNKNIIKKLNKTYWEIDGLKLNGKNAVFEYIGMNPEVKEKLEKEVRNHMGFNVPTNIKTSDYMPNFDLSSEEEVDNEEEGKETEE